MWADSSDLCSHSSSFIHHIAWEPLSWHVRKPQSLTSQWNERALQRAAQIEGQTMSTPGELGILMSIDMWVRAHFSPLLHFSSAVLFVVAWWNITSMLHKTTSKMCYFGHEHCEPCCNYLQEFLTLESGVGSGQREETKEIMSKNKVTMQPPRFRVSFEEFCSQHWIDTTNYMQYIIR